MPHSGNSSAPITLCALGRSGTSLLQGVFNHHPDVQSVGETFPLIAKTFQAAEESLPHMPTDPKDLGKDAGRAVRAALQTLVPGKTTYWFQKPNYLMENWSGFVEMIAPEDPAEFYWRAMTESFPGGRFITILRHPFDVIESHRRWYGRSAPDTWKMIVEMARIVDHPKSPICHAVVYTDLVATPEPTLRTLFAALGIPFHPDCLKALDIAYVQDRAQPFQQPLAWAAERSDAGFSWREKWAGLDPKLFEARECAIIEAMWDRFGARLDLDLSAPANRAAQAS